MADATWATGDAAVAAATCNFDAQVGAQANVSATNTNTKTTTGPAAETLTERQTPDSSITTAFTAHQTSGGYGPNSHVAEDATLKKAYIKGQIHTLPNYR